MSEFRVVMTSRVLSRRDIERYVTELGVEFCTVPCATQEELMEATRNASAVITLMQTYSRRVIESMNRCRLIFNAGTGFNTIDLKAATEHGVCVAYPGEYCTEEVAEHAIALLVTLARKITRLDAAVRHGEWASFEKKAIRGRILPQTFRLRGQTLGLIGCGRIGRAILWRAKGLGLDVSVSDPGVAPEEIERLGGVPATLEQLVESSDFIVLASSYSPGMRHLLNLDRFKSMKRTAYLINVGRGAMVDEAALATALTEGYLAGAALDVIDSEPERMSPQHPLLAFDNVIVTGHSAYYSEESSERYKQRIFDAIARIAHDQYPDALVNPEVKPAYEAKWLR